MRALTRGAPTGHRRGGPLRPLLPGRAPGAAAGSRAAWRALRLRRPRAVRRQRLEREGARSYFFS